VTFYLTDPDGDRLEIEPADRDDNIPALHLGISGSTVHVPLDRVEDLIKGLRETAREVAAYSTGGRP
jgi:hypothetical protein